MKSSGPTDEDLITIGRIVKAWALKGELLVAPLTFDPQRFFGLDKVAVERRDTKARPAVEWKSLKAVKTYKDFLLVGLEGCETPEEAAEYRGALIKIHRSDSPELPEGVYYHYQITGLKVYTEEGEYLGEVEEIMAAGGGDVYVVREGGREHLIPAIKDVVRKIDIEENRMTVRLMEEL